MDYIIVIFNNRTDTMKLYEYLKKFKIKTMIVPTPNQLSKSCGISLKARYKNIGQVLEIVKRFNLRSFNHVYIEKKVAGKTSYIKIT